MTIYVPIQLKTIADISTHVFGGRAHLSIVSKKTNVHFTYRIVVYKKEPWKYAIWVRIDTKYMLVGIWNMKKGTLIWNPKKSIPKEWKRYQAFMWIWGFLMNSRIPDDVFFYRDERCRSCGKRLTNPESIKLGIGPECIKRR